MSFLTLKPEKSAFLVFPVREYRDSYLPKLFRQINAKLQGILMFFAHRQVFFRFSLSRRQSLIEFSTSWVMKKNSVL